VTKEPEPRGRRVRAYRTYECPHLKAQGPLQSLSCWVCGPLRATWVCRPVIPLDAKEAP